MKPTFKLRWTDALGEDEEGPCASNARYWPEMGATFYKLQQWFEDDSGNGEWRDVRYEYDMTPRGKTQNAK